MRIISPLPSSRYLIDPHLPRSQQALLLVASAEEAENLRWTVDGKTVPSSAEGAHFWPLVAGWHTVEALTGTERASAEFIVE